MKERPTRENPTRVLIICEHNSGRSLMAESFLRQAGKDRFVVESAGLEPRSPNPLVVEVMRELGVDLSDHQPQSVFDLFKSGKLFDVVITVCDAEANQRCPIFPGITQRLHWPFPDPSRLTGSEAEKLEGARQIRDRIKEKIDQWAPEQS